MRLLNALLLCLATSPLAAQDIRPTDAARLADFDATAGRALLVAFSGGSLGDVDMLQSALAGDPLPPLQTTLAGDWKCRTLKLGGLPPLTVYAQFDCRITPDGAGYVFEKLTGSQRTTGRISIVDGRMIYLGTGYVTDTDPVPYADLPPDFTGDGTMQPQVGLVEQPSADRARILFPAPPVESDLDLLYLTR